MLSCTWRNPIGSKDTNKLRVIVTRKEKEIASAISRGTTTRTHSRRTRHYIASRDDRRMSNRVGPANFSIITILEKPQIQSTMQIDNHTLTPPPNLLSNTPESDAPFREESP